MYRDGATPVGLPAGGHSSHEPDPLMHLVTRLAALGLAVLFLASGLFLAPDPVAGQHSHQHSPYAGEEGREIKALSADEVAGLLSGEGLGFAKAAELNGIPGPRHVLDLAGELGLTAEQRAGVDRVFVAMREEAVELGRRIVERERALDLSFAEGATPGGIRDLTREIGLLRGRLRAVHLAAHLETAALLTGEQIAEYGRLRGYGD